ncbi:MAG: UDP-glucose dehydrogenase family protein [Christensenellales bacterium]|jgi:UDPglucose 6-dehydrogenase
MKISIIGTGYVGLVTGTCFAEVGNRVYCVDTDEEKIQRLKQGIIPIYEPGLSEMVQRNFSAGNLLFTTDIKEALDATEICFIAVGTPMDEDGSADLQYVLAVADSIGAHMSRDMIVVDKSTVPVGTGDLVKQRIETALEKRGALHQVFVVSSPEFLKEGAAVNDFMSPDRVVIGADNEDAAERIRELYEPFVHNSDRFILMDVRSAEMTKYASNAMLATRISFMNEVANICERVGADVNKVRLGMGADNRIGNRFLYAGCGYGGSCFPKDVQALIRIALEVDYTPRLLNSVEEVNESQKKVLLEKVTAHFGEDLSGKIFAVWGLAFKPETDDMREAPSLQIIRGLLDSGAQVRAYDPQAMEAAKRILGEGVTYARSKYDALDGADALILVTEWKEFKSPDFDEMKRRMQQAIIFDGRNQYSRRSMKKLGFTYEQIGSPVL